MDIEIDSIDIRITSGDFDEHEISREIRNRLCEALGELRLGDIMTDHGKHEILEIDLEETAWEKETGITEKLVSLIKNAINERVL
ncbi:hypothetical protein HY745_03665 [Candidatus Desantisbacteria bacterium]|nr:hypothetical protein [Candidatus Desantisbacteria bacterium]